MLRVISEIKPTWVLGENVAGIVTMALDQVLSDLEHQGYEVQAFIIPAAGVGALHRRKRVFVLGYSEYNGQLAKSQLRSYETTGNKWRQEEQTKAGEFERANRPTDVPGIRRSEERSKRGVSSDTNSKGLEGIENAGEAEGSWEKCDKLTAGCYKTGTIWAAEPDVGRVANGIPSRVDRLKCLGNAVVPQQAYPIFKALKEELDRDQH